MHASNRAGMASGLTALIAIAGLAGCGAATTGSVSDSSSPPTVTQTGPLYKPCATDPGSIKAITCVYGINNLLVFTGPNQLGPADATFVNYNTSYGMTTVPWPQTWAGGSAQSTCPPVSPGDQWCAAFESDGGGNKAVSTATYSAPQALAPAAGTPDQITIQAGAGQGTCNSATLQYVLCNPVWQESGAYANYVFQLNNLPLTVEIKNNLPSADFDSISLQDQPTVSNMILDPKGGDPTVTGSSPQTIEGQSIGYFGGYLPTNPATTSTLSFRYVVSSNSSDHQAGATIGVNVVTSKGAVVINNQTCSVSGTGTSENIFCAPVLQGAPGGPQKLVLVISE